MELVLCGIWARRALALEGLDAERSDDREGYVERREVRQSCESGKGVGHASVVTI
jgi:hypothetical protein